VTAPSALGQNQLLVALREVETSRRSELRTDNYASHTSHPFSCSYHTSHPLQFSAPVQLQLIAVLIWSAI